MDRKAEQGAPSARFTPGPWKEDYREAPVPSSTIRDREGHEIAYVATAPKCAAAMPGITRGMRGRANAALLVAAPDLYEALRDALAWEADTRGRLGLPQVDAPDWAQAATAAIAKVEASHG